MVVSGIRQLGAFEKLAGLDKILESIEIGDQLVSYNGMSFKDYSDSVKWRYGGANDFGSQRSAASSMSVIPGKLYAMPEANLAKYVLKSTSSGALYNVSLPVLFFAPCMRASHSQ